MRVYDTFGQKPNRLGFSNKVLIELTRAPEPEKLLHQSDEGLWDFRAKAQSTGLFKHCALQWGLLNLPCRNSLTTKMRRAYHIDPLPQNNGAGLHRYTEIRFIAHPKPGVSTGLNNFDNLQLFRRAWKVSWNLWIIQFRIIENSIIKNGEIFPPLVYCPAWGNYPRPG